MTLVCKQTGSVVLLLGILLGVSCSRGPTPGGTAAGAAPPKAIPVEAIPVSVRSAQRVLEVTGTLQPFDKVTLSAEVDGPVQRVLVDLGDKVAPGQLLAEINPAEFQIQVAQVSARLRASRSCCCRALPRSSCGRAPSRSRGPSPRALRARRSCIRSCRSAGGSHPRTCGP